MQVELVSGARNASTGSETGEAVRRRDEVAQRNRVRGFTRAAVHDTRGEERKAPLTPLPPWLGPGQRAIGIATGGGVVNRFCCCF